MTVRPSDLRLRRYGVYRGRETTPAHVDGSQRTRVSIAKCKKLKRSQLGLCLACYVFGNRQRSSIYLLYFSSYFLNAGEVINYVRVPPHPIPSQYHSIFSLKLPLL